MRVLLVLLVALACEAQERVRLSGPVVEFSVGGRRTGSIADYGSIQEAVDAAPEGGAVIRVREGVYREVVRVAKRGIRLVGDGQDPGKVRVVFAGVCGVGCGATVTVTGDDFLAEGLTVAAEGEGTALAVSGDRGVFQDVRVEGGVRLGSRECAARSRCGASREYFSGCVVEGRGELVAGKGRAVFEGCELRALAGVVASGMGREDGGAVFEHCRMTGQRQVATGLAELILLHTEMRVGFAAGTVYAEYDSSGMGAGKGRALREVEALRFEAGRYLEGEDHWEAVKLR